MLFSRPRSKEPAGHRIPKCQREVNERPHIVKPYYNKVAFDMKMASLYPNIGYKRIFRTLCQWQYYSSLASL